MATSRTFDARPDRLDLRDLPYRAPLRSLPPRHPAEADLGKFLPGYVAAGLVLDQGSEGACTGFGLAGVANYLFWVRHVQEHRPAPFLPVSPRMLYELARRYDEWPGVDYEGSSCRGALKGWNKHGVCSAACWPYVLKDGKAVFQRPNAEWQADAARRPLGVYYRIARESITDVQAAISDIGAIYVSATVHDGWEQLAQARLAPATQHDQLPEIPPCTNPQSRGGHAFALVGYNERGFVVQNSWGPDWGAAGFAVLPYDDWIVNATDAWACALGVPAVVRARGTPAARPLLASRWRVAGGSSLTALDRESRQPGNPADDPWPVDHPFLYKDYEPWSTASAYEHTLVTGNNGVVVQTDFTRDPADREGLARQVVCEAPLMWQGGRSDTVLRLAVYAHGGLNGEEESIRRIRVLGPCFEANGIYPLFLTWKTGAAETISDMIQDWARRELGEEAARSKGVLEALGEAKDRALEAAAHVLFRGIWSEMRQNAAAAAEPGRGLDLLLRNLVTLAAELAASGRKLELHLVGHSAGGILLGHLLALAAGASANAAPAFTVRTCALYAPACSSEFADRHYLPAARRGVFSLADLDLYVLSDENEKADGLPSPALPAYGKSLLYLVSRALDDMRKMPLLGMQRAQQAAYEENGEQWAQPELGAIQQWLQQWPQAASQLHVVATPSVRVTRAGGQAPATHGSFDNNIDVLTQTLERIRQAPLVAPLEWLDY